MSKLLFFLCLCCALAKAQDREFEVRFDTDSYQLSQGESKKLESFIGTLTADRQKYTVAIAGHTDNAGDLAYNAVLSDNRANAISAIFKANGFAEAKILTSGRGEVHPVADNGNDAGKAKNRRVKIKVSLENLQIGHIGGFQLKNDTYTVSAEKGSTFGHPSGTQMRIPANAFVDQEGKPVTGDVDVKYIEYRDPIDFILSNIKMDHGGGTFNSGGMFKISAYQQGQPVFLAKGKDIDLDFALTGTLPDMNFYQYDSLSGKWTDKGKLADPTQTDLIQDGERIVDGSFQGIGKNVIYLGGVDDNTPMCTRNDCASVYAMKRLAASLTERGQSSVKKWRDYDKQRDSALVAMRAQKDSLYRENPKALPDLQRYAIKAAEQKLTDRKAALNAQHLKIKRMTPIYIVKNLKSKSAVMFRITLKAIYNFETANYNRTSWRYVGMQQLDKKVFDTKWEHCKITDNGNGTYAAMLEKDAEKIEVGPLEIITDTKDIPLLIKSMNEAEAIQTKKIESVRAELAMIENRICEAQAELDQTKNISLNMIARCTGLGAQDNPMLCFFNRSKNYMTTEEQAMEIGDWLQYFDANTDAMKMRYEAISVDTECQKFAAIAVENQRKIVTAGQNARTVTQSLKIGRLGVYNCDQIDRISEPLIVDAKYQDEHGNNITPIFIYLVDSRINGILRYDGYMNYSPTHFAYSPKSDNTLLAFDGEGGSYIMKSDVFRDVTATRAGVKTFVMKKIENIESKGKLRELF
jgi:hypothetical protein